MESSPLTQQARPESFQPKVVELYSKLFNSRNDNELSEGFWKELFLLRPDRPGLLKVLSTASADDLLLLQHRTCPLFARSIDQVKLGPIPCDENALETLSVFLAGILNKKYTNPSSDIIAILAGLDQVDPILSDFVGVLDQTIRNGRSIELRRKAVEAASSMVSGAYQTGLLSYFTHRDLFPSLMKYIQDVESLEQVETPLTLLGLLVNYNKFEFQNPYKMRFDDFVNEKVIGKTVAALGNVCARERASYLELQDDLPEGWAFGLSNTINTLTLGVFSGVTKTASIPASPESLKEAFSSLPSHDSAILLATYDFANANKLFCFNLVVQNSEDPAQPSETPFAAVLSYTSYLLQHAHSSGRTAAYAYLGLLVIRIIIEDQVLCKRICDDNGKTTVRLCRQRQPHLPLIRTDRILATTILDITIDGINHNLRRRLDVELYLALLGIIHRLISHLSRARRRLQYHWSELWRSLLSFMKFLTSYSTSLKTLSHMQTLNDSLVNLIAMSLSVGESFLPGPADYDDLFYKLVETGDILTRFRDAYDLKNRTESNLPTLIDVSKHYDELLQKSKDGRKSRQLNPSQVSNVIKQGYETLSISTKEGLDQFDKYREADYKSLLKRITRVSVADVRNRFSESG